MRQKTFYYFPNSVTYVFQKDQAVLKEDKMLPLCLCGLLPFVMFLVTTFLLFSNISWANLGEWAASGASLCLVLALCKSTDVTFDFVKGTVTKQYNLFEYFYFNAKSIPFQSTSTSLKILKSDDDETYFRELVLFPEKVRLITFKTKEETDCLLLHFRQRYGVSVIDGSDW